MKFSFKWGLFGMKWNTLSVSNIVSRLDVLAGFIHRRISFCSQTGGVFRFAVHSAGKVRRFLLVHFYKSYIQRQLLLREGDCLQCGTCCNFLFACPMLTQKGRCLIYDVCRPRACKVFPIDQRDIEEVKMCGGNCGYGFRNYPPNNAINLNLDDAIRLAPSFRRKPESRYFMAPGLRRGDEQKHKILLSL
jgi:hypothetical protein